ncbi:MAG: hypothetical protein VW450_06025 [Chloroflexota bacterium]
MHVVIAHNAPTPSRYADLGEQAAVDGVLESVAAVASALRLAEHRVDTMALTPSLECAVATVLAERADVVFNLFEGFDGQPASEWRFAQALERAVPCTGASSATLRLCLDKGAAKERFERAGIPTAPWQVLSSAEADRCSLHLPVIVKPLSEDASHGLSDASIVTNKAALAERIARVEHYYAGPALVEEFLPGREFNVAVLGSHSPRVLPPSEMVYASGAGAPRILSFASKWDEHHPDYAAISVRCPAEADADTMAEIAGLALCTHAAVGSPAYLRVDLRQDTEGRLSVIEANPNPDIAPSAGFALQARAGGLSYEQMVSAIVAQVVGGVRG